VTRRKTTTPEQTILFGEEFGRTYLHAGTLVVLRGELGAGKTHFVKGVGGSLGIDEDELTSPTYALANEYACTIDGSSSTLFHLDCYRFEKPEELLELGIEDFLYPRYGATIVEWPERIEQLLPEQRVEVIIHVLSEREREFEVHLPVKAGTSHNEGAQTNV
jgi:tRNA threonylcarbamoyladenosine biosynthesis protein TsaE